MWLAHDASAVAAVAPAAYAAVLPSVRASKNRMPGNQISRDCLCYTLWKVCCSVKAGRRRYGNPAPSPRSHQPSAIICSLGGTVLSRADLLMHAMISGSLGLCFAGEIDAVLFRWQLIVIRQVIGHRADIADERGILGIRHTGRRLLIRRVRRIRSNVAPIRHIRRYWRWPLAGLWSRYATCGGIRQGRRLAGILTRSQRVWRCGRCWPAEGQRHKRLFALFSGFQASLQQQIGAGASGNHTDPDADHPDNRAGTRRRPALRQVLINLLDDLFYLLLNGATIPGRRFAETLEPFFRVFAQRPRPLHCAQLIPAVDQRCQDAGGEQPDLYPLALRAEAFAQIFDSLHVGPILSRFPRCTDGDGRMLQSRL